MVNQSLLFLEENHLLGKPRDCSGEELESNWKSKLLGICLAFCSVFMLLVINTIVQYYHLHYNDVLLFRVMLQIIFCIILLWMRGESAWIKDVDSGKNIHKIRAILFSYGFFGGVYTSNNFIAIYYMPLGDAMTIILSSVLPTMILAAIFLKEKLRLCKLLCTILVITGLLLVIRPPFLFSDRIEVMKNFSNDNSMEFVLNQTLFESMNPSVITINSRSHYYYIAAFAAFICMLSSATFRILMKVLVQNKTTSSLGIPLFYTGMANLILALVLPAFGGDQRILFPSTQVQKYDVEQWIGLFVQAILGVANYSSLFMATKLISPTLVSFIRTSEIMLAYIIQVTFMGTQPYITSLIGSCCVMIACIGIILETSCRQRLHPKIQNLF